MPLKFSDFLKLGDEHSSTATQCSCPACTGSTCLDRPRFFAGQLISEVDLNDQIGYLLAKQRLHNRYLHGSGTVCGLEVVCNSCDGVVTVQPGYAISPCGNDIIVCDGQTLDVAKAIATCVASQKSKSNCDPYRPQSDAGCTGMEQRWCITLKYVETPGQPMTSLRSASNTCSCQGNCAGSCGCGGSKGKKNGTKSGSSSCGCSGSSSGVSSSAPAQCQPTRTIETFELGVVPDAGECDGLLKLLEDTLFARLIGCVAELVTFYKAAPKATSFIILYSLVNKLPNAQVKIADAYKACCQFRQFILKLLNENSSITRCASVKAFEAAACPPLPTGQNVDNAQYLAAVQDNIQLSIQALVDQLRECVCSTLLPPCPGDPGDDRLILACVTMKDGVVVDICNFSCRTFAGGFPTFVYWMSAIPVLPLLHYLITKLCCGEFKLSLGHTAIGHSAPGHKGASPSSPLPAEPAAPSPAEGHADTQEVRVQTVSTQNVGAEDVGSQNVGAQNEAKHDSLPEASTLQDLIMDGNFAAPRLLVQRFGDLAGRLDIDTIMARLTGNKFNAATLNGKTEPAAAEALKSYNITYEVVQVQSSSDIPLNLASFNPLVNQGDHVVVYKSGQTVVGVQSAPAVAVASAKESARAIDDMKVQMASMRAEIATLKASQVTRNQ